jgi:hypothetical protein
MALWPLIAMVGTHQNLVLVGLIDKESDGEFFAAGNELLPSAGDAALPARPGLVQARPGGHYYDHHFGRFLLIFGENIGDFIKKQWYDIF